MVLKRRFIFLKSLLWSIIGALVLVSLFWIIADIFHLFNGPANATKFVDGVLGGSVIGTILGAGLVAWRIADKYFNAQMPKYMKRYAILSFLNIIIAFIILNTSLAGLVGGWSLVSALCVVIALPTAKDYELIKNKS